MTGSASDYLENKLLEEVVGKTAYTMPRAYIALCTSAPTDASTGSTIVEPVAMNYARITTSGASWGTASGGSIANAAILTSNVASGDWGTITHFALCDAATTGNVLVWGELTASKEVLNGDSLSFAVGSLVIVLD